MGVFLLTFYSACFLRTKERLVFLIFRECQPRKKKSVLEFNLMNQFRLHNGPMMTNKKD